MKIENSLNALFSKNLFRFRLDIFIEVFTTNRVSIYNIEICL